MRCTLDNQELEKLGFHRVRLLECMISPFLRSERSDFEAQVASSGDVIDTFEKKVNEKLILLKEDSNFRSLCGAALLLTGDLRGADIILEALPEKTVQLDHGAGYCNIIGQTSLKASLPLPSELSDIDSWVTHSPVATKFKLWLCNYRERLIWDKATSTYKLSDN